MRVAARSLVLGARVPSNEAIDGPASSGGREAGDSVHDGSGLVALPHQRPSVLSIVGPGRSGTTILASILGEVPSVLSIGELRWLWRRGLLEERTCGCGRAPAECSLWSVVLARVLGWPPREGLPDSPIVGIEAIVHDQGELSARRNRLKVIRSAAGKGQTWPALRRMQVVTKEVCSALIEGTGAGLLVDTSKRAQDAAVLASIECVNHYVLHIVRDPRAVAFSWRRPKPVRPGGGDARMGTRRLLPSIARWIENCLGAELLRLQIPPSRWMSIRYEDFAAHPKDAVDRILAFVNLNERAPFLSDDTIVLGPNHIVAGNPSRFRRGPVRIVSDSEWTEGMSSRDQRLVAALTKPLLRRYRYPTRIDGDADIGQRR